SDRAQEPAENDLELVVRGGEAVEVLRRDEPPADLDRSRVQHPEHAVTQREAHGQARWRRAAQPRSAEDCPRLSHPRGGQASTHAVDFCPPRRGFAWPRTSPLDCATIHKDPGTVPGVLLSGKECVEQPDGLAGGPA